MLWGLPETFSVETLALAVSGVVALRVPEPITVAPSLNVTVPLGVPLPGAAAITVAVNVTACPKTDGLPLVVTDMLEQS